MRPGAFVRGILGAAGAALALAGAAAASPMTPPPPAPRCEASTAPRASEGMAALMESLRRAPPPRAKGAPEIVPLDNRGYAYPAAPAPIEAPGRPAPR